MRDSALACQGVSVAFPPSIDPVLVDVDLTVSVGEFVTLLGPSGCGKSTLLNVMAGFIGSTTGAATAFGQPITGPSSERAMVFQEYGLFPWMTLQQNVAYGLRARGESRRARNAIAREWLGRVGLGSHGGYFPHQVSGGMKQRAALARALAHEPRVVLLDEPLAAVDALTRKALQEDLSLLAHEREDATFVYVTHSIEEAVFLGDRVVVMGAAPGYVRAIVRVDAPQPRRREFRATRDFLSQVSDLEVELGG